MVSLGYPYRNLNQVLAALKEKYGVVANPPSRSASASFPPPPYSNIYQKGSSLPPPPSSSGNRVSPAVLFIIVILAVIFFISGLLHLLVRFLIKKPSSASSSRSNRYPDISGSDALQRQLQQLFHLHDSGLDQAVIDALPVFVYKDIVGLKEPFDCAVCLCEFLEQDKLRLLPICSHAFHINCIDTWLLSNSTCPLCRGALFTPGLAIENPVFDFNDSREEDRLSDDVNIVLSTNQKSIEMEEIVAEKRVFPVRLGKYRSLNEAENGPEVGETSSSNLDARRCYSMGSFQYVVGDAQLQVALCQENGSEDKQPSKSREVNRNSQAEVDLEGKKLCNGRKGESFSVSKIWLWPKKGKFPNLLDTRTGLSSNTHQIPVWIGRTQE